MKSTGLSAFTQKGRSAVVQATEVSVTTERKRGKRDVVALTVRLPRSEWQRLHQLAVSEGVSIQTLAVKGFNSVFSEKGLPRMDAP